MRIELNSEEHKPKTALDDDASLYSQRDERTAFEKLKSYKGKEKVTYFCSYFLKPILVGIIVGAILISMVYTIFFKKRLTQVCSLYVINSPFNLQAVENMKSDLTDIFVTDEAEEQVVLDDQYWFASDDYQARMVFITRLASGEVNAVIMDLGEFETQVNNEVLIPVREALPADVYEKLQAYYVSILPEYTDASGKTETGTEDVYGLNVSKFLMRMNETNKENKNYCIGFLGNAKVPLDNEKLVRYMFPEAFE